MAQTIEYKLLLLQLSCGQHTEHPELRYIFWPPLEARKCSTAQGPHSEVVTNARGCEAKRWSHWTCSSLGTIFQPMRINSVPGVKCFCNKKNVLRAQSMVWHFVRHRVYQQAICECSATYGRLQHISKHSESSVVICKCLIFLLYFFIIAQFKIIFGSHQSVCQSAYPIPQSDHMNKHSLYSRSTPNTQLYETETGS